MSFPQNREVCFNQESLPTTISITKVLSDPKVNHQMDKDLITHKLQGQFFTERKHAPNMSQIQYNLPP